MIDVVSLCSGTGALDLALTAFGGRTVLYAERDKNAYSVLLANMERERLHRAPIVEDMTSAAMNERVHQLKPALGTRRRPLMVAGGIPCQGNSVAGARRGHSDKRNLWPSMRRVIETCVPELVLLENVRGLLSVNPSRHRGHYPALFGTILSDLSRLGYRARWTSRLASDAGAPHKRDRVFLLAYRADLDPAQLLVRRRSRPVDDVAIWTPDNPVPARAWPLPRFPGLPQHSGEVPRLSATLPRGSGRLGRAPRLRLLGNAVVPQQAVLAIESILGMGEGVAAVARMRGSASSWISDRGADSPIIRRWGPSGSIHGDVAFVCGASAPFEELALNHNDLDADNWPTPDASASNVHESIETFEARRVAWKKREPTRNGNGQGTPLGVAVRLFESWPTPKSRDSRVAPSPAEARRKSPSLPNMVASVAGSGLYLSPDWVEQLMGLPVGWTDIET